MLVLKAIKYGFDKKRKGIKYKDQQRKKRGVKFSGRSGRGRGRGFIYFKYQEKIGNKANFRFQNYKL